MTPMQRAISLAQEARGATSPNPAVGAVVVKDGNVVGRGYTSPPGGHHAEIVALQEAGDACRGATLYTTLEPCCVHGRTPPCTGAIIAAEIQSVHLAAIDPNPQVSGRGCVELETAGIQVSVGEESEAARELCEAFAKHIITKLPFVTTKYAMSMDGKIATHWGDSQWVTGSEARSLVQQMRRHSDAVLVGVNTVMADDPQLTARDDDDSPLPRQPLRVILDSQARTPPRSRMLEEPGDTVIVVLAGAPQQRVTALSGGRRRGPEGWRLFRRKG